MNRIYSHKEFRTVLEKERARSDRTGHEFSVLFFETGKSKPLTRYFISVLSKRIRCYDGIGWVDQKYLAVLLPETSAGGAEKMAENICRTIIPKKLQPRCTVFTYPTNWIDEKKNLSIQFREADTLLGSKKGYVDSEMFCLDKSDLLLLQKMPLWKRILDIIVTVLGLIILSPLFILIAAFIKTVSPGPVFFKQQRVGFLGETFNCWKFRTMNTDSSTSVHKKHFSDLITNNVPMNKLDEDDNRIIPLGKLLRKSGLDELPQLFNVIRGQMSLIGPRPCIPYEAQQFLPWQCKRFAVLPGLTGLWQVNGKNRTTFNEMMRFDIFYAKNRSLWMDLKILLKTGPAIVEQMCSKKEGIKQGGTFSEPALSQNKLNAC